jgi:prepilin-type N-terminal cleavage/methylation domain-containing protein
MKFPRLKQNLRSGFTLIELLVVISIILIISTMTYNSVTYLFEADRVKNGARKLENILKRARNQAIATQSTRGVRFQLGTEILEDEIKDSSFTGLPVTLNASVIYSSMIMVGKSNNYSTGTISISPLPNTPPDYNTITSLPEAAWGDLKDRGMLVSGARIKIPNNPSGIWYNIAFDPAKTIKSTLPGPIDPLTETVVILTSEYNNTTINNLTYLLELNTILLPNQERQRFSSKTFIDLDTSKIPTNWKNSSTTFEDPSELNNIDHRYFSGMEILFSPDGRVIGDSSANGLINLVVADQTDIRDGWLLGSTNKKSDEYLVSISPITGKIGTYKIFSQADPFRLAEQGRLSK